MMQSLLPAIYPMLKQDFALDFGQVGLITLTFQLTASLLQPVIGLYTDQRPQPYSLMVGMGVHPDGADPASRPPAAFPWLLLSAGLVGLGSAVFHPESSRVARMASGGRHGLAQSLFQVGGNAGSAIGPLLAAFIVLPRASAASPGSRWRRCSPSWCSGGWAAGTAGAGPRWPARAAAARADPASALPVGQVRRARWPS